MGKIKDNLSNTGKIPIKKQATERKKAKREQAKLKNVLKYEALKKKKIEDEGPGRFVRIHKSPFDEKQIKSGTKALFQLIDKTQNKTELFDEEEPIFLQVASVKIPKTPTRLIRFTLEHSLLTDTSEVCLIVRDIGKPKDYDETIEHFQELLESKGVTNIKTIMPYHQFKNEYGKQFELKRKLLRLYDHFLVDAKVSGYVVHLLGKIFTDNRKLPTPVKLDLPDLKERIERSLRKSIMKMHSNGDSFLVQIGHTKMKKLEVFENIMEVVNQFDCKFPGGNDNIRALWIKTSKTPLAIPIFLTLKNRCTVDVPVCHAKRPKNYEEVTDELTTYLHRDVTVLPTGEIITHDKQPKNKNKKLTKSNNENNEIKRSKVKKQNKKKRLKLEESNNDDQDDILIKAEEMYLKEYGKK